MRTEQPYVSPYGAVGRCSNCGEVIFDGSKAPRYPDNRGTVAGECCHCQQERWEIQKVHEMERIASLTSANLRGDKRRKLPANRDEIGSGIAHRITASDWREASL